MTYDILKDYPNMIKRIKKKQRLDVKNQPNNAFFMYLPERVREKLKEKPPQLSL